MGNEAFDDYVLHSEALGRYICDSMTDSVEPLAQE